MASRCVAFKRGVNGMGEVNKVYRILVELTTGLNSVEIVGEIFEMRDRVTI